MANLTNMTLTTTAVLGVYYECSDNGLLLPLVNESTWSTATRAFLYLAGLLWSFLAVAIIANIFMGSIERITRVTTTARLADPTMKGGYAEMTVNVWNGTVPNLSLLALGTSAPVILLSLIEVVRKGFITGELGPGTIVGSAAFNLLVISGICVMSIPSQDTRRVTNFRVFCVAAFTDVGAYIWIGLILLVISPGIVEIWEACVTLALFPCFIVAAYLADRGFCTNPPGIVQAKHASDAQLSLDVEHGALWTPGDGEYGVKSGGLYQKLRGMAGDHWIVPGGSYKKLSEHKAPGQLEFAQPSYVVNNSAGVARVSVDRVTGSDGHVSVRWKTKDITARQGVDYEGKEGQLLFDNLKIQKDIDIPLLGSNKTESDLRFSIELFDPEGGADLGKISETIIAGVNDHDEFNGMANRAMKLTKPSPDGLGLEPRSWSSQFRQAMAVNGGDVEGTTCLHYLLHYLTFGFKVISAVIPPTRYLHGWATFLVSLLVLGLLMALVVDLATIFSCLVGMPGTITAVTLLVLGTSLPGTRRYKMAAIRGKSADSSVGNIVGGNSVGVFLGLGLPWTNVSVYWAVQTSDPATKLFIVPPSSTLAFSVIMYCIVATLALLLLVLRRHLAVCGRAELGGPAGLKTLSGIFFISLWVVFVALSSLKAVDVI